MTDKIREGMEIIGADGVHVGTVDRVEGGRTGDAALPAIRARGQPHEYSLSGRHEQNRLRSP